MRTHLTRTILQTVGATALAACASLASLAAAPGEARAQGAAASSDGASAQHVVVVWVEGGGKRDAEVREAIEKSLPEGVRVVDDAQFRREMVKAGQRLPFGAVLAKGPFRKAALDRTRKGLAALGAEGAVLGTVRIGRGGQEVVLRYVETSDTGEEPDVDVPIPLKGDLDAGVADALGAQITGWSAKGAAPAEAPAEAPKEDEPATDGEPEEDDEAPPAEDDGEARPTNLHGRELLSVAVLFDLSGRWFNYNDGITRNLRDYDVFGAPGFQVGGALFPLAGTDVAVLKDLGLTGRFGIALGLSSATEDTGEEASTSWTRFDVGMRLRVRTGGEAAPLLGLHGGYGSDTFDLTASGALGDEVPAASYGFLRVGVDGHIPMGPVALALFFDYLGALTAGAVYDRFTGSSIGGISGGGGLVVPVASGFEMRLGAEYTRWFYAFAPVVGDPFVAGGALDEHLHLTLGPAYVY